MAASKRTLIKAARQLVETDLMLGGGFMPAKRNPLPAGCHGGRSSPPCEDVVAPRSTSSTPPVGVLSPGQKAAALKELNESQVQPCENCPLSAKRSRVVFGEGNPDAKLVFVGEAPGEEEDRQGRPFVGRAGEKLNEMIAAMGLRREDVYICNMCKCRPPENRTPTPDEIRACWDYLVAQLSIIRPRCIVTLGNPATQNLLDTDIGITKLRGQWQKLPDIGGGLGGTPVMPTFHPAYLLRAYTPENRKRVWHDLQKVMELLGLDRPSKAK
jgi:DNA polymerase